MRCAKTAKVIMDVIIDILYFFCGQFRMDRHLISYYIGILIVFITHIYMIVKERDDPKMLSHSVVNLFAGLFIAYYFTHKEGYIKF